ncbi:DUF4097 family beta strand repeat-containing protein [Nocardia sp. NPDC051030]|uniref:DUF4097 family beta strand repeat-containing protein n=1 Tax=Nocardia sp. NPDC051030 TaxID=3155162 RepID=UPI0034208D5E
MPKFETPKPIVLTLGLLVGSVDVVASDRADTVVEVRPSDKSKDRDVRSAEKVKVEYANGQLLIKSSEKWKGLFGRPGSIDVTVELPTRSQVRGTVEFGTVACDGILGDADLKTTGSIRLDQVGALKVMTGGGDVTVGHATGTTTVTTATGEVRIGETDATTVVTSSNGSIWIGELTGELRAKLANGGLSVDRVAADLTVTSANGSLRIGELSRGSVTFKTSVGGIDIGIREGTATWLDMYSAAGRVNNRLDVTGEPNGADADTAKVYARTQFGDITIRRA